MKNTLDRGHGGPTTLHADALQVACQARLVNRGPNWLFVRVGPDGPYCGLADRLWAMAEGQFVYRMVVEFDRETPGDLLLAMELSMLCDRLTLHGGALRLCGLSADAARVVVGDSGCPRLHNHATARDAVLCGPCDDGADRPRPTAPR